MFEEFLFMCCSHAYSSTFYLTLSLLIRRIVYSIIFTYSVIARIVLMGPWLMVSGSDRTDQPILQFLNAYNFSFFQRWDDIFTSDSSSHVRNIDHERTDPFQEDNYRISYYKLRVGYISCIRLAAANFNLLRTF